MDDIQFPSLFFFFFFTSPLMKTPATGNGSCIIKSNQLCTTGIIVHKPHLTIMSPRDLHDLQLVMTCSMLEKIT